MDVCKNCGAPLLAGSKFCGRCGNATEQPNIKICPTCKNEVATGSAFCNKCGTRLTPLTTDYRNNNSRTKTLIVSRESQFQCIANTYQVIVDGNSLGKVPAGGAVRTPVSANTATVEIICTTVMINAQRRLVLKLGENPRVSFKVKWPGTILETVHDAQVLERK